LKAHLSPSRSSQTKCESSTHGRTIRPPINALARAKAENKDQDKKSGNTRSKKSAAARRSNQLIRFKQNRFFSQYFNKNRKKASDRSLGGR
jgi:hypothetical protein